MSFLDKFRSSAAAASQAASAAAGKASSTAKTATAIARLKVNIVSEEDKLKKAYTELGRLFLRDMDAQVEANLVEYNPWCEKAHDARDAIARMTAEMDELKAQLHTTAEPNVVAEAAAVADEAVAETEEVSAEETPAEEAPAAEAPVDAAEAAEPEAAEEPAVEAVEEIPIESPEEAPAVAEEEDTSIFAD